MGLTIFTNILKISFELSEKSNVYKWYFNYIPNSDILPLDKKEYNNQISSFNLLNNNFQYLNVEHISPQISYKKSEFQVVKNRNIGTKGEYVVHYLSEYGLSEKIINKHLNIQKPIRVHSFIKQMHG